MDTKMDRAAEDKIIGKLKRIEGQVRGIQNMVDEGRECEDILIQISAVSAGITSVSKDILNHHIEHCVVDGIRQGDVAKTIQSLEEAIDQFAKLRK